jgi:hypothetical protein
MHRRLFDSEVVRPVEPAAPFVPSVGGFLFCPLGGVGPGGAWQLYQLAFEQARVALRPSRLEWLQDVGVN